MRYPKLAPALLLAILPAACAPATPEIETSDHRVDLSRFVTFQQHQLSTDLISVPDGVGLDRFGFGWRQEAESADEGACMSLSALIGQIEIFSADGDLEQIELELEGHRRAGRRPKIQIRFNGERLDRIVPPVEPKRFRFDLPPALVRRGSNLLEIVQRAPDDGRTGSGPQRTCLRRVRTRWRSGRTLWPTRPDRIDREVLGGTPDTRIGRVDLPVAGFFDAVLTVPRGAHLEGYFRFDSQPQTKNDPAYLYVQLLAGGGRELTLFHKRFFRTLGRWSELDLDLGAWEGEQVRLRIGTTGSGNGVSHWLGLGITADAPFEIAALPPIQRQKPPSTGRLGRPDVLLLLLDAARADGFSVFGGPHPTPAVERLARDGTAYTHAVAAAPWTGQSVPSILTGLFPDTVRVGPWGSHLPDRVPSIAELMAADGYRTVLWTQHPFYANHQSFRRGFEEYYRVPEGAYEIVPTLDQMVTDDRPTFTLVHLLPPHTPYEPPAPFRGAYSRWYRGDMSVDDKDLNAFLRHRDPAELSADDRQYAVDRYLENVAFADDLVGRILSGLAKGGRYDDALIVLLSDHGEAFLEHGRFLHTTDVHREMLHVPLIVKWPLGRGEPGTRSDQPVSLVDLVPTLVDGLDVESGGTGFQGRSLLTGAAADDPSRRPIYAMTRGLHNPDRPPNLQLMMQQDGWRLLLGVESDTLRLYRFIDDPLETDDLAAEERLEALWLRQAALSQWSFDRSLLGAEPEVEEVEPLDPEVETQLEALGYLQ